jgi:hypothetical protein
MNFTVKATGVEETEVITAETPGVAANKQLADAQELKAAEELAEVLLADNQLLDKLFDPPKRE